SILRVLRVRRIPRVFVRPPGEPRRVFARDLAGRLPNDDARRPGGPHRAVPHGLDPAPPRARMGAERFDELDRRPRAFPRDSDLERVPTALADFAEPGFAVGRRWTPRGIRGGSIAVHGPAPKTRCRRGVRGAVAVAPDDRCDLSRKDDGSARGDPRAEGRAAARGPGDDPGLASTRRWDQAAARRGEEGRTQRPGEPAGRRGPYPGPGGGPHVSGRGPRTASCNNL